MLLLHNMDESKAFSPIFMSSHVEAQEGVHALWHVWLQSEHRHARAHCSSSEECSQSLTGRPPGAPAVDPVERAPLWPHRRAPLRSGQGAGQPGHPGGQRAAVPAQPTSQSAVQGCHTGPAATRNCFRALLHCEARQLCGKYRWHALGHASQAT